MNVNVLAETTRVVVAYCLGVSERLQNGIRFKYLLLDPIVLAADGRQKLQYKFGAFGLACAGLARYYHALVVFVAKHVVIGVVADGKYVRRQLADFFVSILLYLFGRVYGQNLIRIHSHQYSASVCCLHKYARLLAKSNKNLHK